MISFSGVMIVASSYIPSPIKSTCLFLMTTSACADTLLYFEGNAQALRNIFSFVFKHTHDSMRF